MKSLLPAVLVLAALVLARADSNDAFESLVGAAASASSDKGPDAGEAPGLADTAAARGTAAPGAEAKREAAQNDAVPAVSVPPASPPRVWTKVFSSLIRAAARRSSFEVATSTAARRPSPNAKLFTETPVGIRRGR